MLTLLLLLVVSLARVGEEVGALSTLLYMSRTTSISVGVSLFLVHSQICKNFSFLLFCSAC